jgi:hypothetical protein
LQSRYIEILKEKAKEREQYREVVLSEKLLKREAKMTTSMQTRTNLSLVLTKINLQSRQSGRRKNVCVNFGKQRRMYV